VSEKLEVEDIILGVINNVGKYCRISDESLNISNQTFSLFD